MKKTEGNKPKPINQLPAEYNKNAVRIVWIGAAASFIATVVFAYLAFEYNVWQLNALVLSALGLMVASLISSLLIRNGHPGGIWVFILCGQITFLVAGSLIAGAGLVSLVTIITLSTIIAAQTLPPHQTRWVIYLALALGIVAGSMDWLNPNFRLNAPDELKYILPGLISLVAVIYLVFFVQGLRHFSLRVQLIFTFIVISTLSIAVVSFSTTILSRRKVIADANYNLRNAASQTVQYLDDFFQENLNSIRAESQIPVLSEYLSLPEDQRAASDVKKELNQTLQALVQKDPHYITSYGLLDYQGIDVADSFAPDIGLDKSDRDYFKTVLETGQTYLSPVEYSRTTKDASIYFSAPVLSESGEILGVLRKRYQALILQDTFVAYTGLGGQGSYGVLVDEYHIRLAHGLNPDLLFKSVIPLNENLLGQLQREYRLPARQELELSTNLPSLEKALNIAADQPDYTGEISQVDTASPEKIFSEQAAIHSMKTRPWQVVYSIDRAQFLAPIEAQTKTTTLLALVIASLVAVGGLVMAQVLASPIVQLSDVAKLITSGDLTARAPVIPGNEIGALAQVFNTMTSQLNQTLQGLEKRVAERTHELESRSIRLRTAAEVGSTITSVRVLDELLPKITQVISERFGFYHVGIFLLDQGGDFAVLRAANSEGGRHMLERGHMLKVGEVGIVGYVTGNKKPRIAMDVGKDVVFFNNPDLPNTRSEMALPLVVGDQVLGALDVQSTEPGAFAEEDIATLQLLADQVAVAIENARLFSDNQAALEAMRRAYGELSREAWAKMLHDRPELAVLANRFDILYTPSGSWAPEMLEAAQSGETIYAGDGTVAIPIKDRDHILGTLRLRKPDGYPWSKEELSLAQTLAKQLYLALENARLYRETQRRAERERLAGDITAKMRRSNDPQEILQTAVEELRQALNLNSVRPSTKPVPTPSETDLDGEVSAPTLTEEGQL